MASPVSGRFVAVQTRGVIAIPAEIRRRYHLDEPGAQVEVVARDDGVIELRPYLPVPADQHWFWSESWQAGEQRVEEHVAGGQVLTFDDVEDFMAHLDQLDEEADAAVRDDA
jgi:AbrB family looped-hinge helix DNA binding protein